MLIVLVQPVLKCMHFMHGIVVFILNGSYQIGRTIFLGLIKACNILRDIFTVVVIIGEEFFSFLCELNAIISAVLSSITSSANGSINCVLEVVGVFIKHIGQFFGKTRLRSKLLATHIGSFVGNFLNLLKNALLLIADCVWWLITLIPRWLLYTIIAVGDFIVGSITSIRKALLCTTQLIVEDIFRLTIGIVAIFLLWHNRRRLCLVILRWSLKVKRFINLCGHCLVIYTSRIFRRRIIPTLTTPRQTLGLQRRSPLPRPSISPCYSDQVLDPTNRCVICKDRQKCVLLLPCKHLCLCEECADYMFFSAQRQDCPLCRRFIDQSMSVYI